ncbi:MAG: metallophosphoesterase [Acidimicrobiales bacterium]
MAARSELTSVADDEAVVHIEGAARVYGDLTPGTDYTYDGHEFRTFADLGERLATVATVNDVHFGETICGILESYDDGPTFSSEPGDDPYPEVMNRSVIADIAAIAPDAVVAKGDLTTHGIQEEYDAFLAHYGTAFGDRLLHVRGNHDAYAGETFAADAPVARVLPGVVLAVLDTVIPTDTPGQVTADQLEWLDDLAATADRPVLVFGHHHVWSPDSSHRPDGYFGINPDDSERLVEVVARRPAIAGYFAGHTHRNRVRRIRATGTVPWVEVACVKDFPGAWAEYRVCERGILQVHRRASAPEALAWTDKTRAMFGGAYVDYAFGALEDRCLLVGAG